MINNPRGKFFNWLFGKPIVGIVILLIVLSSILSFQKELAVYCGIVLFSIGIMSNNVKNRINDFMIGR